MKYVLVLGMGEIGKGVRTVIESNLDKEKWQIWEKDVKDWKVSPPDMFEVVHVCIPYDKKTFVKFVNWVKVRYNVAMVVIHSTVPPGTTRKCDNAVHVPIRAKHPDIAEGIRTYTMFVGVNDESVFNGNWRNVPVEYIKNAFNVEVERCSNTETTELAKILDLSHYAVVLEFAKIRDAMCRILNVRKGEVDRFTKTRNEGLLILNKCDRLCLARPHQVDENIGGHCVMSAVKMLNDVCSNPLLENVLLNNGKEERVLKEGVQYAKIWEPCNVYKSAKIGCNSSVGMFTEIGQDVVIGEWCRIGAQCYIPEGVTIGNDCFIGPKVTFTNDKYPPSGRENWKKTVVCSGASIGAGSVILPGVTVGEKARVGAGSVVTKDVEPNTVVYGNPAIKQVTRNE